MMEMNEITGTEASQSWVVAEATWPQEKGVLHCLVVDKVVMFQFYFSPQITL